MVDKVSLERGGPSQREMLANLIQLYIHDFNDFLAPERKIGVEEDGRFPDVLKLDSYWTEADRSVWFIRADGQLAGFALLNARSHCDRPVDFNMGEFFVMRAFRHTGVGARAAIDLIKMHPGQWEIAMSALNRPAQAFWLRVVAALGEVDIERLEGDGVQWTGPIMRFYVQS